MWNKGPRNDLGSRLPAKRRRRPSVRLQEIGDCPAASSANKTQKKFRFSAFSPNSHTRGTDAPIQLEVDDPLVSIAAKRFKTSRVLKSRPLVLINSDRIHEHTFSDGGGDTEWTNVSPADVASPSLATAVKKLPHPISHHVITKTNAQKSLKVSSRNRNDKHGGTKAAASMNVRPCSIAFKEDTEGNYSGEDEDDWRLEGFTDSHLETFNHLNDGKELANLQARSHSKQGCIGLLRAQQEYQPNSIQEQGLPGEIKDGHSPAVQVYEQHSMSQEQELGNMNTDGAVSPLVEKANRHLAYCYKLDVDNHSLAKESMSMHAGKVSENIENQRSMGTLKDDIEMHLPAHAGNISETIENQGSMGPLKDDIQVHLSRQLSPLKNRLEAYDHKCDVGSESLTEQNLLPHPSKITVGNEKQRSEEAVTDNTNPQMHSPLSHGVRGWLQNLGLGKYAQYFEAHEVDPEVLPVLTFDDLRDMGITAVGPRRKMYTAIQQLGKCL